VNKIDPAAGVLTKSAVGANPVNSTDPDAGALEHPATFDILTTPTALQRRAFELTDQIVV
jgi:hypothetical protein